MSRLLVSMFALSVSFGCASRAARSVALYESGDFAGAAAAADEGLRSHPGDDDLWRMRIRAALAQGDAPAIAKAYGSYASERGTDDHDLLRELSIATLGQALASPSVKLKVSAIQTVEAAELQALAERVAERMTDDDDRVAAAAAVAVLRGYPQAPQLVDEMLRSEDPEARRIAVDGIGRKIGKLALADLETAANDVDPKVRRAAIRWLGDLKDPSVVPTLTKRLVRDPDESVRAAAANAFVRIPGAKLLALGTQALSDRALAVRLAAVPLLSEAKATDRLLAIAQSDADPIVAAEAAIAVSRKDLAHAALERAIADERWTLRAGAANLAVRAVGAAGALELARTLSADAEWSVRIAAARLMAQAGDKSTAIALLAQAMASDEHTIQAAADLASFGDRRGLEALDVAVRDTARRTEQRSAAVAAHRTANKITPGLVAALADPSGVVRVEAAAVLVSIAKPEPR